MGFSACALSAWPNVHGAGEQPRGGSLMSLTKGEEWGPVTRRERSIGGGSWPRLPGVPHSDTAFLSVKSSGLFSEWTLFTSPSSGLVDASYPGGIGTAGAGACFLLLPVILPLSPFLPGRWCRVLSQRVLSQMPLPAGLCPRAGVQDCLRAVCTGQPPEQAGLPRRDWAGCLLCARHLCSRCL